MRPLPDPTVFSRGEAKALGWTDAAISRALRGGRLVAIRRGQLTAPSAPVDDPYLERDRAVIVAASAAARARADSVISHHVAALLHGLPLLRPPPARPSLTVPPRARNESPDAHLLCATLTADDIVYVDGLPVTSIARTLVDLGRWDPTPSAVVAMDAALHLRLVTPDEIDTVVRRCWNWPRIARAARAIALVDARSESPLETVSRLAIQRLGLPTPVLQPEIVGADGVFIGRVDFYWDEFGVVGEADGAGKYARSSTSLLDEKRRQERLENREIVVARWGWDEVRRPSELRRRLENAFNRGQRRSRSGLPREWSIR